MKLREPSATVVVCEGSLREQALTLEYDVFRGAGYTDFPSHGMVSEYVKYDRASVMFALVDGDDVIGSVRIVRPSEVGLPTLNDFEIDPTILEEIQGMQEDGLIEEFATLSLDPRYRGLDLSNVYALMRGPWADAIGRGVRYWLFAVDHRFYKLMEKFLKFQFRKVAEPKFYMGSLTHPVLLDIKEQFDYWERNGHKELWEFFGRGLKGSRSNL